ncbi:hypothetical protein Ngar_c09050 [Candidatus Nitrososphaera gargensis Ga9.2]|uniref:Uncharacterized protein n=1 Tax=Nitrososphaera gargensis (strain Ga9.2) TaxID=1237085 RepID=K0IIG4_NITGG|nr:hypothetical protein Ngar_c09050 [Candidatus Nitrososphaera gargensis Ga9.2]
MRHTYILLTDSRSISGKSYPLSRHRFCLLYFRGRCRLTTMLSSVSAAAFMSCVLAPSTTTPMGTPLPSTRRLLLVPDLALSVGFGPVLFSPEGRFCHHAIHRLPFPVDSFLYVVFQQALDPHAPEHTSLPPLLEPVKYGGRCAQAARERVPLAASTQDVEDGTHCFPVVHPWTASLLLFLWWRQQWHYPLPQNIRYFVQTVNSSNF